VHPSLSGSAQDQRRGSFSDNAILYG